MATPQKENGHLDLANEIVDQFCRLNLCAGEWRVLWAIFRKTYCWHKKSDRISYSQFEKMTGVNRWNIRRYLNRLIQRNIIIKTRNGQLLEYGFQKDYSKWRSLSKQTTDKTIIRTDYAPLSKQTTKPLSKQITTKEKKETIKRKHTKTLESLKPDDFKNNPEFAGIDIESELVKFKDYLKAKGQKYKDYSAAFRNWLRNAKKWNPAEKKEILF